MLIPHTGMDSKHKGNHGNSMMKVINIAVLTLALDQRIVRFPPLCDLVHRSVTTILVYIYKFSGALYKFNGALYKCSSAL